MSNFLDLYISEDNTIQWGGLADGITAAYINDATVAFELQNLDGTVFESLTAQAMAYVAASDGIYRGTIDNAKTALMTDGALYYLEMTASGTVDAFRRLTCRAVYRGLT